MHFRIQLLRNSARKEASELPALLGQAGKVLRCSLPFPPLALTILYLILVFVPRMLAYMS